METMSVSMPHRNFSSSPLREKSLAKLQAKGWCYIPAMLEHQVVTSLVDLVEHLRAKEQFDVAAIGESGKRQIKKDIRSGEIFWIEDWTTSAALKPVESKLELMMSQLSREFFISLKRFESQLAFYPTGGFYKKHLDQIQNHKRRQVTCIFYLNDCLNGGELVLFDRNDRNKIDTVIHPKAGDCVLFFSREIYHQVLITRQNRYCFTSWFRDDQLVLPLIPQHLSRE